MGSVTVNSKLRTRWDPSVSSPFDSITRQVYPRTVDEILAWAEEMWEHHGQYSQAIRRAIRYFMTEIEVDGGDDSTQQTVQNYTNLIEEGFVHNLMEETERTCVDAIGFGNSFTSIYRPFHRDLQCGNCGAMTKITELRLKYRVEQKGLKGTCPMCKKRGPLEIVDTPIPLDKAKFRIMRWLPQRMRIRYNHFTGGCQYTVLLTEYRDESLAIKRGDPMYWETLPKELLNAFMADADFDFDDGEIFHMRMMPPTYKEEALKGWGLPAFMSSFETVLLIYILDKYNEAIVIDYLMPFRIVSPGNAAGGNQGTDILRSIDMGDFKVQVQAMIDRHRRNPTNINFFPSPVQYQVFGGEAKNLIPVDLLKAYEARLMQSMGIPAEISDGSISATAAPMIAFKLFEQEWQFLTSGADAWLNWVTSRIANMYSWSGAKVALVERSTFDDPAVKEMKMQLAANGEITRKTAYRGYGLKFRTEVRGVQEEQNFLADVQEKHQDAEQKRQAGKQIMQQPTSAMQIDQQDQEAAAAAQQQGAPGAPPPSDPASGGGATGGNSPTVDALLDQAQQRAQEIFSMDPTGRRKAFDDLKSSDKALYAQTKAEYATLEQQAKTQGVQAAHAGQMPLQQGPQQ